MLRRGLIVALGVTAALALPASASAAKFCVKKPKCAQAGGTAHPTIQSALDAAAASGGKDRIELGAKQFDDGPWTAAAGNPVTLVGKGVGKTTLTRTTPGPSVPILWLDHAASRVSGVRVVLNDGGAAEGIRTKGTAKRVRVSSESASISQVGISLNAGGRLVRGRIAMPTTHFSYGLVLSDGSVARESTIRANVGALAGSATKPARGVRLRFIAGVLGFGVSSGDAVLDQATIRLLGTPGELALSLLPTSGDATLVARHVTAIGTNSASSVGARVTTFGSGPGLCPTARLVMRNSILRRFETDLVRSANAGGCPSTPVRSFINAAWSVFDPMSVEQTGDGKLTKGKGNRNVNPRFVKQAKGNYRLKASSPVIDKGQPGKPKAGESKRDLDGRKRVLDGDGNGKARRDVGAFERKRKR